MQMKFFSRRRRDKEVQHVWASFTASILSDCTHLKGEISREMVETIPCCCWLCIPRTGGCEIINLVSTEYMSYVTSFLKLGNIKWNEKEKRRNTVLRSSTEVMKYRNPWIILTLSYSSVVSPALAVLRHQNSKLS
jgi:hypothetical protein